MCEVLNILNGKTPTYLFINTGNINFTNKNYKTSYKLIVTCFFDLFGNVIRMVNT